MRFASILIRSGSQQQFPSSRLTPAVVRLSFGAGSPDPAESADRRSPSLSTVTIAKRRPSVGGLCGVGRPAHNIPCPAHNSAWVRGDDSAGEVFPPTVEPPAFDETRVRSAGFQTSRTSRFIQPDRVPVVGASPPTVESRESPSRQSPGASRALDTCVPTRLATDLDAVFERR